jgi:uncharacterized membrane protein
MNSFSIINPSFLTRLLLPILLFLGASIALRKGLFKESLFRCFRHTFTLLLPCTCIVLALTDIGAEQSRSGRSIEVIIDVSLSMNDTTTRRLIETAKSLTRSFNSVQWRSFASSTSTPLSSPREYLEYSNDVGPERTNLLQVLSHAHIPTLLITDGFPTAHSSESILNRPVLASSPIYPLTVESLDLVRPPVTISQVDAPHLVKVGDKNNARLTISSQEDGEVTRTLSVFLGKRVILQKSIVLPPKRDTIVEIPFTIDDASTEELTASLEDSAESDRTRPIIISAESSEKVVLLDNRSEESEYLTQIIASRTKDFVHLKSSPSLAIETVIKGAKVVVLNNVPYSALPPNFTTSLKDFLYGGNRLVVLGGPQSFSLGGYASTPLDELLPVSSQVPKTYTKRLNVAVVLVLDKSRSTAENEKLEYAKEAAREVIRNLNEEDSIGVIGFDSSPFIVVPLNEVQDIRSQALNRIGRLYPAGKTNLIPALDEARRSLQQVKAGRKHIIVLTDGRLSDSGNPEYDVLAQEMRLHNITTSTVLVGNDSGETTLQSLARRGGGLYYEVDDASDLPKIFLQDIRVNTNEKVIKESSQSFPVRHGPDPIVSTSISQFLPVKGFVETNPKQKAAIELLVGESSSLHPLLASWKIGGGEVVSLTTDASGRWTSSWLGSSLYTTFVRDILFKGSDPSRPSTPFDIRTWFEGDTLHIEALTYDMKEGDALNGTLTSSKHEIPLSFSRSAPGRFTTSVASIGTGLYRLQLFSPSRAFSPYSLEVRPEDIVESPSTTFNLPLLHAIALKTQGKVNPSESDLLTHIPSSTERTSFTPLLVLLSALTLALSILIREKT